MRFLRSALSDLSLKWRIGNGVPVREAQCVVERLLRAREAGFTPERLRQEVRAMGLTDELHPRWIS